MPPWWAILLIAMNAAVLLYLVAFGAWTGRVNRGLVLMYDSIMRALKRD